MRPSARLLLWLSALGIGGAVFGCEDRRGGEVEVYRDVAATVVAAAPERREVTVAHEAIPGVMEAMTMPLEVEDPTVLRGLSPGDRVRLTLRRIDGRLFVRDLAREVGRAPAASPVDPAGLLGGAS
jgi:Cu/Ag efflux protein CusF